MSTRADMLDDMRETAQALVAAGCPLLPAMYVPSKGEPVYHCCHCKAEVECDERHRHDGQSWDVDQTWPDMTWLPDLTSDANGLALLVALRMAGVTHVYSWTPPSGSVGGYYVTAGGMPHRSEHLAHAAAKAWLAWRGVR